MNELIFSEMKLGFQTNHKFYGTPSIILTVCGCKYECVKNGEPCKAANIGNNKYTIKDAKEFVLKNNHIKHIVIDGGEPLLYKKQIEQLLTEIYSVDKFVIVYTKGGLPILNPLNPKFKVYLYIIDLQDKEIKNISTLEDTYLNETNKHSISLNNDSFLNLSSISTESKSSFFSKFNQINSNEAEIYDKKLEEVEKMYRENISELQNELNKAKKEIELLKKGENVSNKMSPELKKGVENLIFSIKIKKKNKTFMVNIMKQIGYSDEEIQQILKKNGEMQE